MAGRIIRALLSCTVWAVAISASASAQSPEPRVVVTLNGGVQAPAGTVSDRFTFDRNVETATVDVKYPMKAAVLFDVGAGVRFWKRVGAGLSVSRATGDNAAGIDASIPHPLQFQQPRQISGTQNRITRAETGVHVQLQYSLAATRRVAVVLSAGPSWLKLEQELVTGVTYDETYPYDTATFRGAETRRAKGSAVGFNAGADLRWMFGRSLGLGGMVRYTRGTVAVSTPDARRLTLQSGGLQAGAGLRIAF